MRNVMNLRQVASKLQPQVKGLNQLATGNVFARGWWVAIGLNLWQPPRLFPDVSLFYPHQSLSQTMLHSLLQELGDDHSSCIRRADICYFDWPVAITQQNNEPLDFRRDVNTVPWHGRRFQDHIRIVYTCIQLVAVLQ